MNQDYTDIIQQVSQVLLQAIKQPELNLAQKVEKLDCELAKFLRLIGLQVISTLWAFCPSIECNLKAQQLIQPNRP